jgi:hypothetical protein
VTVYSETRRQIVHITMAVFALPLGYLTWAQAALMAAGALAFNAFLLPRIAPGFFARLTPAECEPACSSTRSRCSS